MQDIAKKLIAVLRGDVAIQTLTGATAQDSRVYAYYEPEAYVETAAEALLAGGATMPAYLSMALLSKPNAGTYAVIHPVFSFAIWARDWDVVEAIRDRIAGTVLNDVHTPGLLHKQVLTTGDGRKIYSKVVNENDSAQVQPDFRGRTLHVRAGYFENP